MTKIKVGVVRGGPSSEYEVSLKTGGEVLKHLPENYHGFDILLSKESEWHLNGFPQEPGRIFDSGRGGVDVIFNAMHGEFGEDGRAQQLFESFRIPYTGSGIISSAMTMKKQMARELFVRAGLKVPKALFFNQVGLFGLNAEGCAREIFNWSASPWVIKPASAGSSVGVTICRTFPELLAGVAEAAEFGGAILAEEYIKGREATCGVLDDFRNERHYALPVVEIVPPENTFFDYTVKYDGSTREICPAGFDGATKVMIEEIAKLAHEILGCRHYSRSDFIVSDARLPAGRQGVYLLETNTLPGLTSESLLPKAAAAAGLEFPQLLDHLIKLALNRS